MKIEPRCGAALVACLAVLGVVGCGGGGSDPGELAESSDAASAGAKAYRDALAERDYPAVCRLQTRAKIAEKLPPKGNPDPFEACVGYYEDQPELAKSAGQEFSVGTVALEPEITQLALVETDAGAVPMILENGDWKVAGQPGEDVSAGRLREAVGEPEQDSIDVVSEQYAAYQAAIADENAASACRRLSEDRRLVVAQTLDRLGTVGALCIRAVERDEAAAAPTGAAQSVSFATLTQPTAELAVGLGGLDGTWFMSFEEGAWKFDGGGLSPSADDGKGAEGGSSDAGGSR